MMRKQPYTDLLQTSKNAGESQDTFEFEGEKLPYPRYVLWSIHEDVESRKSEYRSHVICELLEKKTEQELLNLPCKEKIRRYSKNLGLELLASTIEGATAFLWIGGMHITCDGIREKKELTYRRFKADQQQDITDRFCRKM